MDSTRRRAAAGLPTAEHPAVSAAPPPPSPTAPRPPGPLRTAGRRLLRRRLTIGVVGASVAALLGWYVVYTQRVVRELRSEAERQSQQFARGVAALGDTASGAQAVALFDIVRLARQSGIPIVLTEIDGTPKDTANVPFTADIDGAELRAYVATLDRLNAPVADSAVGTTVHYGDSPLVRGLNVIPAIQAAAIGMLVLGGLYALLVRARAEREHVWAGMARESAHQLGTPLSSISGWIALLDDASRDDDASGGRRMLRSAVPQMQADLERLERVAHRFERIGRPPREDAVDVGELAERIAAYFRARVPTRSLAVAIHAHAPAEPVVVRGDAVLLEWVLEVLTKNAVDALAGRGGRIDISAERLADGAARVRVADDGPGVPREWRRRIFDPGFTTKERGWGIGLSLARRIVEENHGGRLALAPTDRGAAFDVILR